MVSDASHLELGYIGGKNLLQRSPNISAIFAITDEYAVGVYHAAADLGLSIPDDISVVGYDDIPLASHVVPRLTTVAQPIQQLGEQAAQLLFEHIDEPDMSPKSITLRPELVVRNSTRSWPN